MLSELGKDSFSFDSENGKLKGSLETRKVGSNSSQARYS